ncbi:hypothetical protein PPL_01736 [Heterostelium album PN500]|uniref:Uncharacterized protein n=1 Tax=Heterostelium pallidum (strain ATCC 26659 / Pp 5 / PN500) TaxID=670386 RepID=D3B0C0_HETP5|nr:hypothetical protein PPL_01736 [Heterostelium album PN500]EFA84744.1 hypothetical protein PPL_01736 [Heterostelium album PN500]|eukprot:XP_020436856.1 hypothetical protein PPL_01736 [Heterostelium album PN500]
MTDTTELIVRPSDPRRTPSWKSVLATEPSGALGLPLYTLTPTQVVTYNTKQNQPIHEKNCTQQNSHQILWHVS